VSIITKKMKIVNRDLAEVGCTRAAARTAKKDAAVDMEPEMGEETVLRTFEKNGTHGLLDEFEQFSVEQE